MIRKEFPKNREKAFVAQKHFPRWLDELEPVRRKMGSKFLMPQPFPGVELKAFCDWAILQVHEAFTTTIPTDVLDVDRSSFNARLRARVLKIEDSLFILGMILNPAEIERGPGTLSPCRDQPLMDRIELIGLRVQFLQPKPLGDRCLYERSWCIRVVFQ